MTRKFVIKGLVQGIGYRPFVAKIADELKIGGWVRNTGGIVTVLAIGEDSLVDLLYVRLSNEVPSGGFVTSIDEEQVLDDDVVSVAGDGFRILESNQDSRANLPLIPADIATCEDCKRELLDRNNRRYRHPFISCTICGPRYSIIQKLPYDRDTITMSDFDMCPDCHREYVGRNDRRRHAQTIACKNCGPELKLSIISGHIDIDNNQVDTCNDILKEDEIDYCSRIIRAGGILAIKDIGGYHLACDPFNSKAVAYLRILKHREAKAFAIMFEDVDSVRRFASVNDKEAELLNSPARPIVLVRRVSSGNNDFADNVCLTSPDVGAMLPCNPVQILLARSCGPIIMTSGNGSGDVLETDDERMYKWLTDRASTMELEGALIAMLSHNRRILRPMDDSVMKVVCGRQQFIRRARGYVPSPIPVDISSEIFAAGGDLKASFCYVKNGLAYVSQYLGDMESVSCQNFYHNEKNAMKTIFGFSPDIMVTDRHPGYFSRRTVIDISDELSIPTIDIQHHRAHVASVIAEYNLKGKVLGFAFDGTGYGDDGKIWGSETFLWDGCGSMERVSHLKPVKMIGGDEGARNCSMILAAYLHEYNLDAEAEWLFKERSTDTFAAADRDIVSKALDMGVNTIVSTSMGRLFDAVSALLDICHYNSYEGQAPIELENIAAGTDEIYPVHIGDKGDTGDLFSGLLQGLRDNVSQASLARGFVKAVSDYIVHVVGQYNINQIVLSGGTFLNRILLEYTISQLEEAGFRVYIPQMLPPGDGGICLGQAYLADKLAIK